MPALITAAGDLVLLVGVLVLVGCIMALQHTLVPALTALHHALGWVPGVGSLTSAAESAVNTALSAALTANLDVLDGLYRGLTWALGLTFTGMKDLAAGVDTALHYLRYTSIPNLIELATVALVKGAAAAVTRLEHLETGAASLAKSVDARFTSLTSNVHEWIAGAEADALRTVTTEIAHVRGDLTATITTAVAGVAALPRVTPAELTRAAEDAAAATAAVALVVAAAGLNNAECAAKVKGICGTNPAAWAELLAGLAVIGFAFDLAALYEVAKPLVGDLEPIISRAA